MKQLTKEQDLYKYNVNYYIFNEGIFNDHYIYIDDKKHNLTNCMTNYSKIKLKGLKIFESEKRDFVYCIARVDKKERIAMETKIFPKYDDEFLRMYGEKYNDFIKESITTLHKFLIGEIDIKLDKFKG